MKWTKTLAVRLASLTILAAITGAGSPATAAEDTLKLAVGQRGLLDTAISHLGQEAGIFKKHGLKLEILYTQGAGETMQAVISSSVDIGVGAGTGGVLAAFVKNAPVRILSAEATGSAEFWYVPADSPIKTLKDAGEKTIAYSTAGSSTNSMALALSKQHNPKLKLVATGSPPSTLTQAMSKQVDIGWASPPFGLKEIDEGKIRVVARATDALEIREQTMRVNVTNLEAVQKKKDQLTRYMRAYRETIAWIYTNEAEFKKLYAPFAGVSEDMAKRIRDDYFPRAMIEPDKIAGLDTAMADAVNMKFITEPLKPEQIKTLILELSK
jgi:NitT/TauT family transport system substrate-binding protein